MPEQIIETQTTQVQPPVITDTTKNKKSSKIFLFVILSMLVLAGAVYAGMNIGKKQSSSEVIPQVTQPTPTPDPTADWKIYRNAEYGFEFKYPQIWTVEANNQVFKEGDIFSALIMGKTQKEATEFSDGARFTIAMPIKSNQDIETWVNGYYPVKSVSDEPNEFSQINIGGRIFEKVRVCGLGCFDYLNIKNGDNIYRFMLLSEGPQKSEYVKTFDQILSTFKFLD